MPAASSARPGWLIELATCSSTNSWALDHLRELADGACVWTEHQTAGRGRGTRRWLAPAGVLTASFVVPVPAQVPVTYLSLCAGLVIAHAVEDHAPTATVQVKWPNDCYLSGRKLAGVLCERPAGGAADRVVIGIGLNLDPRWEQSPEALLFATDRAQVPASVVEICDPAPAPIAMLTSLRRYLLESTGLLAAGGWKHLLPQLRQRDWLSGQRVRVESAGERVDGVADGIDDAGRLLVRLTGGATRTVSSAESLTVG
ncbi:MAG: biotin--[acetyl-CoA-carboxylase] ligase [Planctomycetes bacterium]|nr:biotin--[acetyl-CoA-carboxylase] ligase [Planctomycetota bacterium]